MTHLEIEAFLAICKHKTISKAAAELFISQSTLSERLKTLEGKLNHTLLLRHKGIREITLTPEGHTFYNLALQYKELIEKMNALGDSKPPHSYGLPLSTASEAISSRRFMNDLSGIIHMSN